MKDSVKKIYDDLDLGFSAFWVKKHKISFLLVFLILISGFFSLFTIPKESSPDIKFGVISITTPYIGVNPNDIDALITEKIENEIRNIQGIKKINSTSSVGLSSVVVELFNTANTRDVMTDIKDTLDSISLPDGAEESSVIEISSDNELMFEALLYGDAKSITKFDLMQKAQILKSELEGIDSLASIEIGGSSSRRGIGKSSDAHYEIQLLIEKDTLEVLGLGLPEIANIIKSYNKNTPLGNYTIDELHYDFRFEGGLSSIQDLKNIVIRSDDISQLTLGEIASVNKKYKDDTIRRISFQDKKGLLYVPLIFNKKEGDNIFRASKKAKYALQNFIESHEGFTGLDIEYSKDLSEVIIDDYRNLGKTAVQTLVFVFLTILFFVGLRESIIASTLLPLSFLITFIVLDSIGFTLNFLTNFSLVLTLGIAIDTVIVIIEGASEKMSLGYTKKSSILLAIRDYRSPLISGTMTTLVAFLPLIFLPGVMGKFLSYIPITVFTTLLAGLVLSLTVSSALFTKFVREPKTFKSDPKLEESFSLQQKEFLEFERRGKRECRGEGLSWRKRLLYGLGQKYYDLLGKVIRKRSLRYAFIIVPVLCLFLTFISIVPRIGFTLFPQTDNSVMNIDIKAREGLDNDALVEHLDSIDKVLGNVPELKVYYTTISGGNISVYMDLLGVDEREEQGLRDIFELEDDIIAALSDLESLGLQVSLSSLREGPPRGKAVGIKLRSDSRKSAGDLEETALIFKEHIQRLEGVKNVQNSTTYSPGQFIFQFDRNKLAQFGLTPNDFLGSLYSYTNGLTAGSIQSDYEDNTIKLFVSDFYDEVLPSDIENLILSTRIGQVRVGDFVSYEFASGISSIRRIDGDISISVEAELTGDYLPSDIQPLLEDYARKYSYPQGVSYQTGGETEENRELIMSIVQSFFIALFLIFGILVFQFNSFLQPIIVLYSVVLATLGVNIGLFITGNPFSITFMIGFVALVGVVVNDAIILIDRMNKNIAKGMEGVHAIISAGKLRLQPIIVTTLTTMFGILPLALQDAFWSGLGYTIIFGLFAGSSMTLFVIPCLYFGLCLKKKEKTGI